METGKRYSTARAVSLFQRVVDVRDVRPARARKVFAELLRARLTDVVVVGSTPTIDSASDADIAELQKGAYIYLGIAVGAHEAPAERKWPGMTISGVTVRMDGPSLQIGVSGSLPAMLTIQLHALFRLVGDRLRQCPCGREFVKVRRQNYCSGRCQKRYYMREYRA